MPSKPLLDQKRSHHVVAQVFLSKALVLLVFLGGFVGPGFVNHVGQKGELWPFLQAVLFPLVGQLLADLDALEPLVDPVVCVAQALVVAHGLLDAQLWVLQLVQALAAHFGQPQLEGFGPLAGDGLDEPQDLLGVGHIGQVFFAISSRQFQLVSDTKAMLNKSTIKAARTL